MNILKLKLKNYMSFDKVNLTLEPSTLYIVTGENRDIGGKNGIGKSALVESLVFSIYGKNIRVGSKDIKELITNGKRELKTHIQLDNGILIDRTRTKTKSSVIVKKIDENGKLQDLTKRTNTETDLFINEILIPFERFTITNYFNPNSIVFFQLTPKQRFSIIEELLNITILNELQEKLKQKQATIDESIQKLTVEKVRIESKLEVYDTQLANYLSQINKLKSELDNIETKSEGKKKELEIKFVNQCNQFREKYNELLNKLKETEQQLSILEQQIKEKESQVNISKEHIEQRYKEIQSQLSYLEHIKEQVDKAISKGICPVCNRPYVDSIEELISKLTDSKFNSLESLNRKVEELKSEFSKLTDTYNIISELEKLKINYQSLQTLYQSLKQQLEHFKSDLQQNYPYHYDYTFNFNNSALFAYIEEHMSETDTKLVNTIKQNIVNLQQEYQNIKDEQKELSERLSQIESELSVYESIKEKLTILLTEISHNGEFRQSILTNYLSELESSLNIMIKHLNPNLQLKLTIEQSGRNKGINVTIIDSGIEKSYGQLSTGERRMVDISLLLTFSSFTPGFLVIDEALDSLSYENQLKVVDLIQKLDKQVFLVTHNQHLIDELTEISKNKRVSTLYIVKENGVSTVKIV